MKCAYCACENPAHAQFCMRCGAPVGNAVTQPHTVPYVLTPGGGRRSVRRLRAILLVAGLLALAGGGFALTRAFLAFGHLLQSPETASVPGPLAEGGGRITDTGSLLSGQRPLPSPPQPTNVTTYPQNAPGVGGYPSGNLVQTPGMAVPTDPLTERGTQIAETGPLTERGNYLPNTAPLTERAGPIPLTGPLTDQNARLPAVTPPTERTGHFPETTPPVERRISDTPPATEREETPPPKPPTEVVNYLRFLKEIETRRQILCREQVGHIQYSHVQRIASTLLAEMSDNPELRHRQNYIEFHRSIAAMSRDWQILNRTFASRPAPIPCRTLRARYIHLLQITTNSIGMVVDAFRMAMSGNPQAAIAALSRMGGSGLGSASRAVAEACRAADAELAAVYKRFHLSKDFEIQDE